MRYDWVAANSVACFEWLRRISDLKLCFPWPGGRAYCRLKPPLQKKLGKDLCLSRKSPRLFVFRDAKGIAVRTHRQSSSGYGNAPPSPLMGNCLLVTNMVGDGENQLDLMSQSLLFVLPSHYYAYNFLHIIYTEVFLWKIFTEKSKTSKR